jgi:hypothetical protein
MATDKFLSYSKFNKKYTDPIISNKSCIPFGIPSYYILQTDSGISQMRNQYLMPRSTYERSIHRSYVLAMENYTSSEKAILKKEYESIGKDSPFAYQPKVIYPYSLNDFVQNFYSDYIPSERDYIINSLLDIKYIIPFEDYIVINSIKLPKDEYKVIVENWKQNSSLNRIVDLMKEAQDILYTHKRDLNFLINKVDQLSEENKILKQNNVQLTNNVVRASQITWS